MLEISRERWNGTTDAPTIDVLMEIAAEIPKEDMNLAEYIIELSKLYPAKEENIVKLVNQVREKLTDVKVNVKLVKTLLGMIDEQIRSTAKLDATSLECILVLFRKIVAKELTDFQDEGDCNIFFGTAFDLSTLVALKNYATMQTMWDAVFESSLLVNTYTDEVSAGVIKFLADSSTCLKHRKNEIDALKQLLGKNERILGMLQIMLHTHELPKTSKSIRDFYNQIDSLE